VREDRRRPTNDARTNPSGIIELRPTVGFDREVPITSSSEPINKKAPFKGAFGVFRPGLFRKCLHKRADRPVIGFLGFGREQASRYLVFLSMMGDAFTTHALPGAGDVRAGASTKVLIQI
jgi:hypothetical protein